VLASAKPGYEFLDWGRAHHIGGGSHGSLHAVDSLGSLAVVRHGAGVRGGARPVGARDFVPMVLEHFGAAA
jgi:hypothetical protein